MNQSTNGQTNLTREFVKELPPVAPAKTNEELLNTYHLKQLLAFNANENPLGASPLGIEALQKEVQGIHRYPDSSSAFLREALAAKWGLSAEQVILSNGCDNIITVVMSTFIRPEEELIVGDPSFFMYGVSSQNLGARLVKVPLKDFTYDLNAILAAITPQTKMIVICNPNNPTGTFVDDQKIEGFMAKVPPHILVVMDEAYAEFVAEKQFPDTISLVKAGRNVIVFRTFSKLYGLAGLRVGYALAPKALIDQMRKIIEYFPVNRLAAAAARGALQDQAFVTKTLAHTQEAKAYFEQEFAGLGLDFVKTSTNFMFVNTHMDSQVLVAELEKKGILVKAGTGWGFAQYIRFSFGTMSENRLFMQVLQELLVTLK